MSLQKELIAKALRRRLRHLCDHAHLVAADFEDIVLSVPSEKRAIRSSTGLNNIKLSLRASPGWMEADADCLSSLQRLARNELLKVRPAKPPATSQFLESLRIHSREPERCFQLLTERYACPLNFAVTDEDEIREYILMRLMVQDRARIENESISAINTDDLLLKLNLVAICASATDDLRFLDALNYYYELLPSDWLPHANHDWLLTTYFSLYARALATWL